MPLKNKEIILLFPLLTIIISIKNESLIVFPFKSISIPFLKDYRRDINNDNNNGSLNNTYNSSTFFDDNYLFRMLSPIKIGNPPQDIIAFINTNYDNLLIGKLLNIPDRIFPENYYKGYKFDKSSSFVNLTKKNIYNNDSAKTFIAKEDFYLYTNINDIKDNKYYPFQGFKYMIENQVENKENNLYGLTIGLILDNCEYETNFMRQIHDRKIISSYLISFEYTQKDEGMIIIGKYPHELLPGKYSENQFKSFYSFQPSTMYLTNFIIEFSEIYSIIDNERYPLKKKIRAIIILNSGLIIGTKEYMEFIENKFFNHYIILNICEKYKTNTKSLDNFIIFYCNENENLNLEKFPILKFNIKSENLTFEFNGKDLFKKIGNKYYFLIEKFDSGVWRLGKPLYLKYTFVYNGDAKTIGFYQKRNELAFEKPNNKTWKLELDIIKIIIILILFLIFLILVTIFAYHFGKKFNLIRKKHANELNDEYDYISSLSTNHSKIFQKDINKNDNNAYNQKHIELTDESKFKI